MVLHGVDFEGGGGVINNQPLKVVAFGGWCVGVIMFGAGIS